MLLVTNSFLQEDNSRYRSYTYCLNYATCAEFGSLFTIGLFLMLRARLAYFSEFKVSSKFISAGDIHAIIDVRELPPRESYRMRVSLESR